MCGKGTAAITSSRIGWNKLRVRPFWASGKHLCLKQIYVMTTEPMALARGAGLPRRHTQVGLWVSSPALWQPPESATRPSPLEGIQLASSRAPLASGVSAPHPACATETPTPEASIIIILPTTRQAESHYLSFLLITIAFRNAESAQSCSVEVVTLLRGSNDGVDSVCPSRGYQGVHGRKESVCSLLFFP